MKPGLLLLALSLVALGGCSSEQGAEKFCNEDSDCTATTCCHPSDAVNQNFAPDCSYTACTDVCSGPLDCGAGQIKCQNNQCVIIPS